MIKNLKYRLADLRNSRRVRIGGMALFTALTIIAVTLLGCPIHTTEILDGQRFYNLNKAYSHAYAVTDVNSGTSQKGVSEKKSVTYPVYVTCGDETVTVEFTNGTVKDALLKAGFEPDKYDFVEPALKTKITKTSYIDYTDIEYVKSTTTKKIPYSTKVRYTSNHKKGYTKITTKGVAGKKKISYTEKFVNGVSQGKTITKTKVLSKPVQAVKVVGTKVSTTAVKTSDDVKDISTLSPKKAIKLDKNGNPINYKKKMTVRATAYTYTGNNCSTGVAPQPGYIAVNPKVIPYGTKMYIKSPNGKIIYGYAVAADTGGFIRNHPTGIDLFMTTESACRNFGVRQMEIYILE